MTAAPRQLDGIGIAHSFLTAKLQRAFPLGSVWKYEDRGGKVSWLIVPGEEGLEPIAPRGNFKQVMAAVTAIVEGELKRQRAKRQGPGRG